ncbi:MAG: hypothetical protein PUF55_06420 [Bacteroidales bacterium]|nr:hypothetical protein [Bacteroidales bacterium]
MSKRNRRYTMDDSIVKPLLDKYVDKCNDLADQNRELNEQLKELQQNYDTLLMDNNAINYFCDETNKEVTELNLLVKLGNIISLIFSLMEKKCTSKTAMGLSYKAAIKQYYIVLLETMPKLNGFDDNTEYDADNNDCNTDEDEV